MCNLGSGVLEYGIKIGEEKERAKNIRGTVELLREMGLDDETIVKKVKEKFYLSEKKFHLSEKEVESFVLDSCNV